MYSSFIEITVYEPFPSNCYDSVEPALWEMRVEVSSSVTGLYHLVGPEIMGSIITSLLENSHRDHSLLRMAQRCATYQL